MNTKKPAKLERPNAPVVTDGIVTEDGQMFVRVTGQKGSIWINVGDFHIQDAETRKRIFLATGCATLTASAKTILQNNVEAWNDYRAGIVASYPGWNGPVFACGDGRVVPVAASDDIEDILFDRQRKFEASGALADWQLQADPFLRHQTVPFFACCVALVGPILRFVPGDILNPQIEFVGAPKTGKSSVGIFAASVWGGNPEKSEGGGENWNMTAAAYDKLRRTHKDMFMLLDEAEGTDSSATKRAELAKSVVFGGASGDSKARYTDTEAIPVLKMAMLSTTNTSIREVLGKEPQDRIDAIASRMMSLRIVASANDPGGMPVFETLPLGFDSHSDAVRSMRNAADRYYGTAGPAFAEAIALAIRKDERVFREELHSLIEIARTRFAGRFPGSDERHIAFLAVVEATTVFAQRFGILRTEWGVAEEVVEKVILNLERDSDHRVRLNLSMRRAFFEYFNTRVKDRTFQRLWDGLLPFTLPLRAGEKPMPQWPGMFVLKGKMPQIVYIDPEYFRSTFAQHKQFLGIARLEGWLVTSPSEPDRLQKHAPTKLRRFAFKRVHEIDVTRMN